MRQFSYIIRRTEDIDSCIARFCEAKPTVCRSILVSVYTTSTDHSYIANLTRRLDSAFPSALIAGCMTTDTIRQGGIQVNATVVSFSVFETSEVRVEAFCNPATLAADGKKFCEEAKRAKYLAAVGILGTVRTLDIQPFLDELAALDENIVIYGGGANTLKNVPACVFTKDKVIEEGIVAVSFLGAGLHVHASLNFGWKPLGREFTITKMTGDHIVEEIDSEPAARIYETYLNIPADKNFARDTLAFPVFVRRGDSYIARHTTDCGENGALIFIADLHEGEKIRLSYGDPREMIEDAKAGCADMAAFRPEAISILSCYAHRMFLHGDVKFELEPFRSVAPSQGFYTYGEIFRFAGRVGIHNMMLLTVRARRDENAVQRFLASGGAPRPFCRGDHGGAGKRQRGAGTYGAHGSADANREPGRNRNCLEKRRRFGERNSGIRADA